MSQDFVNFLKNLFNSDNLDSNGLSYLISTSKFSVTEIYNQCIELFVQLNFIGPTNANIEKLLSSNSEFIRSVNEELTCEGVVPFLMTKGIILLWIIKELVIKIRENKENLYKNYFMYLKYIYLHHSVLQEERSEFLKGELDKCYNEAMKYKIENAEDIESIDEFQFLLLSSYLYAFYYDDRRALKIFNDVQELLGISTEFVGALGRKTKLYNLNFSQLCLRISRQPSTAAEEINSVLEKARTKNLPNDQMQEDDTYFNQIEFVEHEDSSPMKIPPPTLAEQAVVVLKCRIHRIARGKCESTMEECAAILDCALGSSATRSSTWSLVTEALFQRCQLRRASSSRRAEYSLKQIEELSNQFVNNNQSIPPGETRIDWFFLSRMSPIWMIQSKLGQIYMETGMFKAALDIMLPWQLWKSIIDCLMRLGERRRAELLIRDRMRESGETVELLCCLGDVTKDRQCYEAAWQLSKRRSARAMLSLAQHFMFIDCDHSNAARCFEASLACNSIQPTTWFTYGCCCLQLREYRKAVDAFMFSTRLESDNYEAWNNCASALIELGEKKSALKLLNDATKYNYDNWRIWDNICLVSAQIDDFPTTINAYHRVMDLNEQYSDAAILKSMTKAVVTNKMESIRPKLKELFARIVSHDSRDPRIWRIYGELLADDEDKSDEMKQRVLQCYSRAHHGICISGWQHNNEQCKHALISALELVDKSFEYDTKYTSAKLAVKSLKAVFHSLKNSGTQEFSDEVNNLLSLIDEADIRLAEKM